MTRPRIALCAQLILAIGCLGDKIPAGEPCDVGDACQGVYICFEKACRMPCNSDEVCARDETCRRGVCLPATGGDDDFGDPAPGDSFSGDPDDATFACADDTECASGYRCYLYSPGDGVCVSEDGCSSDADCGAGKYCVPGEAVCAPERKCTESEDCPAERPYCNPDQVCTDPCAAVDCPAQAADTFCIVDLAAGEGYQCLPCEANPEACGPGRGCVRSNLAPDFRCAAACPTAGEPCSDGSVDGWCAEVEGVVPGGSSSSLAVCAVCDPTCSGTTPECAMGFPDNIAPNLESAAVCQTAGGPCTAHSDCGTSNYCAVQSGGSYVCVRECAAADSGCEDINGQTGWCVDAEIVGGGTAPVCGSCPATCGEVYQGCGSWPGETTFDQAVGCVCVDDAACAGKNTAAFRCVEGTCTDACDPTNPAWEICPDLHVCQPDNVCGLCGNGEVDAGTSEVCDDSDPDGGYCLVDCSAPECNWGLVFKSPSAAAGVLFPARQEHNMDANGFTIDLWARVTQVPAELVSRSAADGTAPYYRLMVNSNWGIGFYVNDATAAESRAITVDGAVAAGVLHRITAVRAAGGDLRVEVDGTTVATGSGYTALNIVPTGGLRLGYFVNGAFPADLEMDGVRVIRRELTAAELAGVRRCEHFDDGDLVGEWLFDMAGAPSGPSGVVDTSPVGVAEVSLTGSVAFGNVPWQP